jgi:hypothetical protein
MPRFRLGGKGDPDSDPNFMANNDNVKTSVHLLGKLHPKLHSAAIPKP